MANNYYIVSGNSQHGPFTREDGYAYMECEAAPGDILAIMAEDGTLYDLDGREIGSEQPKPHDADFVHPLPPTPSEQWVERDAETGEPIKLNMNSRDWCLYTLDENNEIDPASVVAAEAINVAVIEAVKRYPFSRKIAEGEIETVRRQYAAQGAADTEPRWAQADVLDIIYGGEAQ